MPSIVQQRIEKWNKTSSNPQKVDVECFCLWLGKSKEEIISEFYSIEKASRLEMWKRDYGDYIYTWYKALMEGTRVYVKKRIKGKGAQFKLEVEERAYEHNTARRMAFTVSSFIRQTCSSVVFDKSKKIPKATVTTKEEHEFTIEQLKDMFVVGDVEERAILQLGVNLAFRVNDFRMLPREVFERMAIAYRKGSLKVPHEKKFLTGKRKIVAYAQITKNSLDTLSAYLKTKRTSKYLFTKNHKDKPMTEKQLNHVLKDLWKRAFPDSKKEAKYIHWHCLRKYLRTVMFGVEIPMTAIDLITGHSVSTNITTYLQTLKRQKTSLNDMFMKVLAFVELGEFIAIQPRDYEEQTQRELMYIQAIKTLADEIEKLTGKRPKITFPVKRKLPTPEELKHLLNNNNHS